MGEKRVVDGRSNDGAAVLVSAISELELHIDIFTPSYYNQSISFLFTEEYAYTIEREVREGWSIWLAHVHLIYIELIVAIARTSLGFRVITVLPFNQAHVVWTRGDRD